MRTSTVPFVAGKIRESDDKTLRVLTRRPTNIGDMFKFGVITLQGRCARRARWVLGRWPAFIHPPLAIVSLTSPSRRFSTLAAAWPDMGWHGRLIKPARRK